MTFYLCMMDIRTLPTSGQGKKAAPPKPSTMEVLKAGIEMGGGAGLQNDPC